MAEQELKVKISVDPDTGGLKVVKTELDLVSKSADKAAKSTLGVKNTIDLVAHASQAVVGGVQIFEMLRSRFDAIVGSGVRYNATLEQTQLALKATLSGYIEAATGAERIAKANVLAASQMEALKLQSAETGVSFGEISAAFKTFLPGALSVGMSMDKATKAAARLTQAAKIQGVEFNALLAGIDGVAKGTILANSDFGRFLGGLGLTNEALKEAAASGKTYELIMSKLADIPAVAAQGAKGYATSLASLNKTIEELRGELTKPIFEAITESMQSLNSWLVKNQEDIKALPSAFVDLAKSAAVFATALVAIKGATKAAAVIKAFSLNVRAARIETAMMNAVLTAEGYGAVASRATLAATATNALSAAQNKLKAAFAATPWGIVIAGLTAVIAHFAMAKSAAEELAESWDGAIESLNGRTKAQVVSLRGEIEKQMRANSEEQASIRRSFLSGSRNYEDLSIDEQAEIDTLKQKYSELQKRIKTLDRAYGSLGQTGKNTIEAIKLKTFNSEDASRILKELQAERDKAILTEIEKLDAARLAMVDELIAKVAPDTDEFRDAIVLIGEIYSAEYQKITDKAQKEREAEAKKAADFIAKINDEYLKATAPDSTLVKAQFDEARAQAAALLKEDKAALEDVVKKLGDMERIKLTEIRRAEYQKTIDEAIRTNNAIKEIEELAIDNAVLRGEITEEEANRKKQILAYDTEILNIERQIAALNPETDIVRIGELEKTKALLTERKNLASEDIIPTRFQEDLADAVTNAFLDGLKNGEASMRSILSGVLGGVGNSFMSQSSAQISGALSKGFAGGGFNMGMLAGGLATAGVGLAVSAVASELTAKWELVESRDILQEIADNTAQAAASLSAVAKINAIFGTNHLTAAFAPTLIDNNLMGGGGKLPNSEVAKNLITDMTARFYDDNLVKPYLVAIETYKKKSLLGSKTKTKDIYAQLTEAQAQAIAFLKQFGGDNYGGLNAAALNKFSEHIAAIGSIFAQADRFVASINGRDMTEYAFGAARSNLDEALEAMKAYVVAANSYGAELQLSYSDATKWLTANSYEAIVGALGGSVNADALKEAMERLTQALDDAREAAIAYYEAIYGALQSEAEFIEWLANGAIALKSALDDANRSLYNVIASLRLMASEARDMAGGLYKGDSDYYQRLYMQRLEEFNALFDGGELRGDVTQTQVRDAWNLLSGASSALMDATPDYRDDVKQAMEASLLGVADMLDLSADILSVRIVGDSVGLASEQTIGELIKAIVEANNQMIGGATLSWNDIGFDMEENKLRTLGTVSGVKTRAELDNLSNLLATLKTGDYESDRAVWESLLEREAQGDVEAAKLLVTGETALDYMGQSDEIDTLNKLKAERQAEEERKARIEAAINSAAAEIGKVSPDVVWKEGSRHPYVEPELYLKSLKETAQATITQYGFGEDETERLRKAFAPYYSVAWARIVALGQEAVRLASKWSEDHGGAAVALYNVPTTPPPLPFAKGGIVKGAELFGFDRQLGVMGEAGAEAVVPLPDGRSIPVAFGGGFEELGERLATIEAAIERLAAIERASLNFMAANDRRERRYMIEGYPVRDAEAVA